MRDGSISPKVLHKYAVKVSLDRIATMRTFIRQFTLRKEDISTLLVPLHIRGGYDKWNDVLHALLIFYIIMDEDDRKYEIAKARNIPNQHRERYRNNIEYLHNNRVFIDGRQTSIELDTLKLWHANDTSSNRCFIERRAKINLLNETFHHQVITHPQYLNGNTKYIDHNIDSFIVDEFGSTISRLMLPMVKMNTSTTIEVITPPVYTPAKDYKKDFDKMKGAECILTGLHAHPNVIRDSSHFEATIVLFDKERGVNGSGRNCLITFNDGGYDNEALHMFRQDEEVGIKEGTCLGEDALYPSMLLKEALTFIKAMACFRACGIPPVDGDKYMNELRNLLYSNTDRLGVNGGLESLLVEYMHGFTENRNHTTVSCQSTRNKEVQYELLSVIDRLGCDTRKSYLYFPLDNIVYEFDVNHSITVTNFRDTMYVVDPASGGSGEGRNTTRRLCVRQSSTLDPTLSLVPSSYTPSNVKSDHKYDEDTDDDEQASDHPIKTEDIKEEDTDDEHNVTHSLPVKKEEDTYDMDTDDDGKNIQKLPDMCMSSHIKSE